MVERQAIIQTLPVRFAGFLILGLALFALWAAAWLGIETINGYRGWWDLLGLVGPLLLATLALVLVYAGAGSMWKPTRRKLTTVSSIFGLAFSFFGFAITLEIASFMGIDTASTELGHWSTYAFYVWLGLSIVAGVAFHRSVGKLAGLIPVNEMLWTPKNLRDASKAIALIWLIIAANFAIELESGMLASMSVDSLWLAVAILASAALIPLVLPYILMAVTGIDPKTGYRLDDPRRNQSST